MIRLGAVPGWCWWLIALVLVSGGQQYRVVLAQRDAGTAQADLASYRLQVAERDRRIAARDRTEEQTRQRAADEDGENARKILEAITDRATTAESNAHGMLREITRLRAGRSATCGAIATQQRQAGTSAVVVLGGLLEEADRMAGVLATALERSRVAGLACESIMDGMRSRR